MVLQLDHDYSSSRVESNFVAGSKTSFSVGTKVLFFGLLRSMVSGLLQFETVFHVMLQRRTIRYFPACCLQLKTNKLFLVVNAVFFGSNSQRINIYIPSCPKRFYSKEVVVL